MLKMHKVIAPNFPATYLIDPMPVSQLLDEGISAKEYSVPDQIRNRGDQVELERDIVTPWGGLCV